VVARELVEPPRAAVVKQLENELLALYRDPTLTTKPPQLDQRGGRRYSLAAIQLVSSLLQDSDDVQVVNLRNNGVLPFLPDDAVIEAPARITAAGPVPLVPGSVQPAQAGLIAHTYAYEQLALEAATLGGRDRVFKALLAHPLIGQYDQAARLTELMMSANHQFLPWA
jgi:6-phospho-beta-glucosidase